MSQVEFPYTCSGIVTKTRMNFIESPVSYPCILILFDGNLLPNINNFRTIQTLTIPDTATANNHHDGQQKKQ